MPRVLAIDPGEKRVGLALSDERGILASPVAVLRRDSLLAVVERIAKLVAKEQVSEVVVGVPVSLSGELGPQARRCLRFAEAVRAAVDVPVQSWNEQYSTAEAQRMLSAAGRGARRQRQSIDAAAAAVMLQDYLDSRQ